MERMDAREDGKVLPSTDRRRIDDSCRPDMSTRSSPPLREV